MTMQMYIVAFEGGYADDKSREIQRRVLENGGFILMVTRSGPLVAIDDSKVSVIAKLPQVAFVGPVTLNPRGYAAERLQHLFAENLSKQITIEIPDDGSPVQ